MTTLNSLRELEKRLELWRAPTLMQFAIAAAIMQAVDWVVPGGPVPLWFWAIWYFVCAVAFALIAKGEK